MTVVKPPASTSVGATRVGENSSGRRKRKTVNEYNFHCPCDRCEGQSPFAYKTVSAHIAKLAKRIKTNANSKAITEQKRARLLELSDRINDLKAMVKSHTWREVAVENHIRRGDQVERTHQPDTNDNVGS